MIGWIVVLCGAIVTLWTLFVSIYWCIRPGETAVDHPKYRILRGDR